MMKSIRKPLKISLVLLVAVIMMSNATGAMAADYKASEVKTHYTDKSVDNYSLVTQANKCHFIITDTNVKENGKTKDGLVDLCISGKKVVSEKEVAHSYKSKYVGKSEGKYLLRKKVAKTQKNIKVKLKPVKNSSDNLKEYTLKISKSKIKTAKDVDICKANKCGRYLYYVLTCVNDDKSFYYYQKYDVKSNKLVFSTELKNDGLYSHKIDNDALYTYSLEENTVTRYDKHGKVKETYQLPEGEQFISYENKGKTDELRCYALDINDNKIYYCNRNGVYKCDMKKGNSFELIYAASGDRLFNPGEQKEFEIVNMKVMDNESFYLFVSTSQSFTGEIRKVLYYSNQRNRN